MVIPRTALRSLSTQQVGSRIWAMGITLGSTLGQLRAAYGALRFVGVDKWQAQNGLAFADAAEHDPEPPSSQIIEVKIWTCGDF